MIRQVNLLMSTLLLKIDAQDKAIYMKAEYLQPQ